MAQVKKFQTPAGPIEGTAASTPAGTPAEVKKKYGRWIRNGIAYEMDDEKMKDLEKHIMSLKPELQPYAAEEYKRLLSGKDVTIDTMLNQRDGVEDYAVLNDRQEKRLQNGKTKEGILNSLFNTPTHKFNVATYELGKWDPSKNVTTSKSDKVEKTKLAKRTGSFAYDLTDKNQNRYKDYQNQDEMTYLKDILNYLDGVNRDRFDITGFDGIADIESVYKQKGGKEWAQTLIDDILAGKKVDGEYKDFLDVIGLSQSFGTNPEITQQKIDNEVATKKNTDWTNSDYNGAWSTDDRDRYFTHNADGTFTFKGSLPSGINLSTGNYYFNDEFVEENPMYSYLSGKINYDGKWYSEKDLLKPESLLYQTLAAKDYFNMNKRGEYGNANNIMKSSWKGQENLIPAWGEGTEDYLGDFYGKRFLYENRDYNMPDTKIRIQTGLDESGAPIYVEKDIDDNWVIRRGVDLSSTNFLQDGTGRRPWSWKITDAYGNEINDIDGLSITNKPLTYDSFIGLYDGSTATDQSVPTPRTRISGDQYSPYYNRYADANDFGFTAYRDMNGNTVHVSIPTNFGGEEGIVYKDMPINVYETISNPYVINEIMENPKLARAFFDLVRDGKNKGNVKDLYFHFPEVFDGNGKVVGYRDDTNDVLNYFINNPKRIKSPESFKKGGVIKAQGGAVVKNLEYSDSQKSLDKAKTLNQTYKNPYTPQMVRENGNWDLWKAIGDSDKLEMYGLAADGLGMIAGMVPVYGDLANVALSTIGANILYGISDRRKVKAGAMPKGTVGRNLAMSLGADTLSLVPAVGELANMTRWGSRLKDFALKSEPFAKGLMATFATIGAIGAADSFGKLMRGEDLNMDDFKELIYGTMSALGLVRTTKKAISDSRLAKNSAPTPEQPTRTTKFKAEDGTEQSVTLDEGQISQLTSLRAMGENKSKEALATMLRNKGVPAEEINRILGNSQALKELGLIRETPRIGPTHYSEVKPEPTHGTGYYFLHPFKRTRELQGRTVEQLFQGANDDPRAAARWINANLGYSKLNDRKNAGTDWLSYDVEGDVTRRHYDFNDGSGTVENYGYGKAKYKKSPTLEPDPEPEVTSRSSEPEIEIEPEVEVVSRSEPELVVEPEPMPLLSTAEWNTKFNQYSKIFGTKYSGNKTKAKAEFDRRIQMLRDDSDFKTFFDTDPQSVKLWLGQQIDNASKATRLPKGQIEAEVKRVLGFKKGGVIKAANGQWFRNIWGSAKDLFENPDTLNAIDSGTRFISGNLYNKRSTDRTVSAIKKAVNLSKSVTPIEHYSPNYINAGNAQRQLAQSKFQYRPAVFSDPNQYNAWKKQSYDEGNLALAQGTQLDSQQHSQNLLRGVEERKNYANIRAEGINQWRNAGAAGGTAIAEAKNMGDRSATESFNQLVYQRQAQRDANIQAASALGEQKLAFERQQSLMNDYNTWYNNIFTKDKPYDPSNVEHNKAITNKQTELSNFYQNKGFEDKLKLLPSGAQRWYNLLYAKKGGSLRPASEQIAINREKASDQIRVNKAKSQDKQWENSQKEARKALDKMSDRVHDILMKLLS